MASRECQWCGDKEWLLLHERVTVAGSRFCSAACAKECEAHLKRNPKLARYLSKTVKEQDEMQRRGATWDAPLVFSRR